MQINDEAIILKKKKFKESSLLVTFFSLNHGLNTALVKGVLKKNFGIYEIGNRVHIKCNFRLEEQLWNCKFELIKNYSVSLFNENIKLNTLLTICSLINLCLPNRLSQEKIYKNTVDLLDNLILKDWIKKYIFWELLILSEIGYGLDLKKCTVTGSTKNLFYVSPKSGKAVSYSIAKKYKKKLLKLPNFLINHSIKPNNETIKVALDLTGFFLKKYLKKFNNRNLPFYRKRIIV